MADIIDNASQLEDLQRDAALSMHRLNHSAVSATHCVECGDKLLDARRKAYPGCTMWHAFRLSSYGISRGAGDGGLLQRN